MSAIDQINFLQHSNLNGNTISMRDVQQLQTEFWMKVYIASIECGQWHSFATNEADEALISFNARFVPKLF